MTRRIALVGWLVSLLSLFVATSTAHAAPAFTACGTGDDSTTRNCILEEISLLSNGVATSCGTGSNSTTDRNCLLREWLASTGETDTCPSDNTGDTRNCLLLVILAHESPSSSCTQSNISVQRDCSLAGIADALLGSNVPSTTYPGSGTVEENGLLRYVVDGLNTTPPTTTTTTTTTSTTVPGPVVQGEVLVQGTSELVAAFVVGFLGISFVMRWTNRAYRAAS